MRKVFAWLGVATLFMVMSRAEAANDVLKPYVVMILDTSGSMGAATGSGPSSCGKRDTRLNHAVCAINSIVNSYGEMVFALGRFRETNSGSTCVGGSNPGAGCSVDSQCTGGGTCSSTVTCDADGNQEGNVSGTAIAPSGGDVCNTQGRYCGDCDPSTGSSKACTSNSQCLSGNCVGAPNGFCDTSSSQSGCYTQDAGFEMLTALVDGNNAQAAKFTDGTCNSCTTGLAGALDPEIWGIGKFTYTPLTASIKGAQRYWEGSQLSTDGTATIWARTLDGTTNNPGFDPINRDPAAHVFLTKDGGSGIATIACNAEPTCDPAPGCVGGNCCCISQCRPYITILLTDGAETCTQFSNTTAAVADLLTVTPNSDAIAASTLTRTGNLVTITTPTGGGTLPHPFKVGDQILVQGNGTGTAPFLGTYLVTAVPSATSFQYQTFGSGNIATITNAGNSLSFAAVRHRASRHEYTVLTKVIGFGIAPGDSQIEALAHEGGALDGVGNEGYYAQDEADLELAISQILADSVRAETCNNRDDDCDTKIDEDFPNKGASCTNGLLGACLANGVLECQPDGSLACNAPTVTGTAEICNGIDDNCDGLIDNGITCTPCVPTGEICDGLDNDCDGVADQTCRCVGGTDAGAVCANGGDCNSNNCGCTPITRGCGVGVCGGTETCTFVGGCDPTPGCTTNCCYTGCTAQQPNGTGICSASGVSCTSDTQCIGGGNDHCVFEICDGIDNDCDGVCDGFSLDCSQQAGACTQAATSCPASDSLGSQAHYTSPDAAETACNDAVDDDLDGKVNDGCPAVGPAETGTQCDNATDDDGDTVVNDGCPVPALPIAQNICQPGTRTCPLNANCNGSNSYGSCSGEVLPCNGQTPCVDTCNNVDDDCDNKIDEDFASADCSTNCGIGSTVCQNGQIVCNSTAATDDPTCDNVDDDCDGKFDEDWLCTDIDGTPGCDSCSGPIETCDSSPTCLTNCCVCSGIEMCVNGNVVCGSNAAPGDPTVPTPEVCNCVDDDCDGTVDENPTAGPICPGNGTCVNCQCAFGCAQGEFPCPLGKKCETSTNPPGDFCVNDPCFGVTCGPVNGNLQTCTPKPNFPNEPQCVDVCSLVNNADSMDGYPPCAPGQVCVGSLGECRPDNCITFPDYCTADQACVAGVCVTNTCQGVTCDSDKYCVGGACVSSCSDVNCPSGQRCRQGACEADPCGGPCPFGEVCNDTTGQCISDPCKFRDCPEGQWCNPNANACEDDPCQINDITCPKATDVCRGGTCVDEDTLRPDAAGESHVTVGGGGGCNTSGGGQGLLLALGALGLFITRRRRTVGGAL